MTSPASARCSNRRGFTLTEVLVVIGILVLIAGLLLPMITRAYKNSARLRTSGDLQAISLALEAFKQDFGDYPDSIPAPPAVQAETGFAVLTRSLVGPGYATTRYDGSGAPASVTVGNKTHASPWDTGDIYLSGSNEYVCTGDAVSSGPPSSGWVAFATADNAGTDNVDSTGAARPDPTDNGFRPRAGGQGRIYGPYLNVDKFKTRGMAILDQYGKPILYMRPARVKPAALTVANSYVHDSGAPLFRSDQLPILLFDSAGVGSDARSRVRAMLGDYNIDGKLDPTLREMEAKTSGYILWSAGPDGLYGPKFTNTALPASGADRDSLYPSGAGFDSHNANAVSRCDDVTNIQK